MDTLQHLLTDLCKLFSFYICVYVFATILFTKLFTNNLKLFKNFLPEKQKEIDELKLHFGLTDREAKYCRSTSNVYYDMQNTMAKDILETLDNKELDTTKKTKEILETQPNTIKITNNEEYVEFTKDNNRNIWYLHAAMAYIRMWCIIEESAKIAVGDTNIINCTSHGSYLKLYRPPLSFSPILLKHIICSYKYGTEARAELYNFLLSEPNTPEKVYEELIEFYERLEKTLKEFIKEKHEIYQLLNGMHKYIMDLKQEMEKLKND